MATKKTRFRLQDGEKLLVLQEFIHLICEDITSCEVDLWNKLLEIMCLKNPDRYRLCTTQNLRKSVLHQVDLYKGYESPEATASGKERLQTKWGEIMKSLMTVWCNYEHLVQFETAQKNLLRKRNGNAVETDADVAKKIRSAALGGLDLGEQYVLSSEIEIEDMVEIELKEQDDSHESPNLDETESQDSTINEFRSFQTKPAIRPRNKKRSEEPLLKYFVEMKNREIETEKMKIKIKEKLAMEELEVKKKMLEFEIRKFEADIKEREAQRQINLEKELKEQEEKLAEREEKREDRKMLQEERKVQLQLMQATTTLLNTLLQSDILKRLNQ